MCPKVSKIQQLQKSDAGAVTNPSRRASDPPILRGGLDDIEEEAAIREWIARGELSRAAQYLVREHFGCVLAACTAIVRDRSAAEDLAQEVFSAAFVALPSFRGESKVRTWLLGIARHRSIDHLRALRRAPLLDDAGEPDDYVDEAPLGVDLVADRARLEDALASLEEAERALVVLRYMNGLEYSELAGAFGVREGTIRMRLSRALARMRAVLEADERRGGPRARMRFGAPSVSGAPPSSGADLPDEVSLPMPPVSAAPPPGPHAPLAPPSPAPALPPIDSSRPPNETRWPLPPPPRPFGGRAELVPPRRPVRAGGATPDASRSSGGPPSRAPAPTEMVVRLAGHRVGALGDALAFLEAIAVCTRRKRGEHDSDVDALEERVAALARATFEGSAGQP